MKPITRGELDRWKQLAEAATAGPWRYEKKEHWPDCAKRPDYIDGVWLAHGDFLEVYDEDEARFIAASRTALPELIAEVERLNVLIENQSETIQKYSAEHYKRCTLKDTP